MSKIDEIKSWDRTKLILVGIIVLMVFGFGFYLFYGRGSTDVVTDEERTLILSEDKAKKLRLEYEISKAKTDSLKVEVEALEKSFEADKKVDIIKPIKKKYNEKRNHINTLPTDSIVSELSKWVSEPPSKE